MNALLAVTSAVTHQNPFLISIIPHHIIPFEIIDCTELCRRVGNLLRTVVLLEEPVSIRALAHLMGILEFDDILQMDNDVRSLGSVLLISESSGPNPERFSETVSTFHPSFRDFLVDPQRCSDERFFVEPARHQHKLLYRCLQLLNRNLCTDVCGIRNPGVANAALQNLPERLAQSVPEAVRYAGRFWQIHLVASGPLSESVFAALLELCTDHALQWLEVLSLLGELSSAGKHLARSIAWCQVSLYRLSCSGANWHYQSHLMNFRSMQDIFILLKDIHRVLRAYAIPITSHALQVYHSVLATGPCCKLLDRVRSGLIVAPRLMSQRASDWSPAVQVMEGHISDVSSVAYSPDGAHIVSGSDDKTVRVWDAQTGKLLAVLEGHSGSLNSVAFSPDGAHIVSGSYDKTVRVWDAQKGQELAVLQGHSSWVRSVAFSPDGAHIVSGSDDKTVWVWDAQTGKELAVLEGHSGWVQSVAFSPDGAHIVSGSNDKTVRVWDAQTGRELAVLKGHNDAVLSVAFSPDGAHIVSGSCDETVRVWDAQTGKELAVLKGHRGMVLSVAFSPDGAHIVSGSEDQTVRVWDAQTGKELAVLEGHSSWVLSVAFSPDGAHIVSVSNDKTVRVWDAQRGKELAVLQGHSGDVRSVAFSPDGAHIVSGSDDQTVRVWDAQTGKELAVLKGHSGVVLSVVFSPDGAHIVSASDDNTVRVWDAQTGKELAVLQGHSGWVQSVAFSPDGAHIVSGSNDKTVRVWDAQTGKELAVLQGHGEWVNSVAFSPDGAHIVSGSDDQTVRVWDAQTGKELAVLQGHSDAVRSVAFSPDGAHISSRDWNGRELSWNVRGTVLFPNHLRSRSWLILVQMCAALKRCRGIPLRLLALRTLAPRLSYGTKRLAGSPGKPRRALFRCRFAGSQLSVAVKNLRAMAPQPLSERHKA
jgi:WD40 repeat protein